MTHDLLSLTNEVRLFFHQLSASGEALHRDEPVSMGMRAVLEHLFQNGATTVPDIARARGVTRQHIQTLVNELIELGTVRLADNPAHKRSSLVELSQKGKQMIQRMKARENRFFADVRGSVAAGDVRRATRTLRLLRLALKEAK